MKSENFINDSLLQSLLKETKEDKAKLKEIFAKSMAKEPLSLDECAQLLAIESKESLDELYKTAKELKKRA